MANASINELCTRKEAYELYSARFGRLGEDEGLKSYLDTGVKYNTKTLTSVLDEFTKGWTPIQGKPKPEQIKKALELKTYRENYRQRYENEDTLHAENEVKQKIERITHRTLYKLPISYGVDYAAFYETEGERRQLTGFVEVKNRSHAMNTYPDVIISALKIREGLLLSKTFDVAFIMFFQFIDKLMWAATMEDMKKDWRLDFGGRTKNTRDSADIELIVRIPTKELKILK